MSKYELLGRYLALQARSEITLPFSDIEAILGTTLPPSAFQYREWWANETNPFTAHTQCIAWRAAGYCAFANLEALKVRFVRKPNLSPAPPVHVHGVSSYSADDAEEGTARASPIKVAGPLLLAFGGLPGVGKTTIARQVARTCGATYLRIDEIEQAIRSATGISGDVGAVGYTVAYAIAEANLQLGHLVVANSVNPIAITRKSWRMTAASAGAPILDVEIWCSDLTEHRRRVEKRTSDIPGFTLPHWGAVKTRTYELWTEPHLVIDTAQVSADEAATIICEAVQLICNPA